MKHSILILSILLVVFSCHSSKKTAIKSVTEHPVAAANDTIKISNKNLDYDIIIIEPGFNAWLIASAKPKNFYNQKFLEGRNIRLVTEWNNRASQPYKYNSNLYEMSINYQNGVNYGFDVNYKLYNYFIFFQNKYKQNLLGGRIPLN